MQLFCNLLVFLSSLTAVLAFSNPVLYQDLPDVDLRRYNDTYYLSTSTFHYSPGAPIMRSYDLKNWEFIGHSVPSLSQFGAEFTLPSPNQRAYIKGIWASWLIFVPGQNKWFWGGCINFQQTHIFSSSGPDATSGWSRIAVIKQCYYDSGAILDDNGQVYVTFKDGNNFWVSQMAPDMKTAVKTQIVYPLPSSMTAMEGTRPYKRNGQYYILTSFPSQGNEYALKSSSIWGPYTQREFVPRGSGYSAPLVGSLGQGALVDTPGGQWYYMAFSPSYPGGRIPVVLPVNWSGDGWPSPVLSGTRVAASYPDVLTPRPLTPITGTDSFKGNAIGTQWEWNHDPDTSKFSVNDGLTLNTATVSNDWYNARNTLARRTLGPVSTATIRLDYGSMAVGDRAGLGIFRDQSAYIGVFRTSNGFSVNMVNGINMDKSTRVTTSVGSTIASASVSGGSIWLRIIADITTASAANSANFYYSTNGATFTKLGNTLSGNTDWPFFLGMRYAVFNFATTALGGKVTIPFFDLTSGSYTGTAPSGGTLPPANSATSQPPTTTAQPPPPSGNCAPMYGQCGGEAWTGAKCCSAGKCTATNQWYSQCV